MVSVFLLSFSQDLYIVKSGGFAYYDKKALKGDFMNGKTVEDYKREMLEMYTRAQSVAVAATPSENLSDFSGGLQINATTLRRILPVEGAVVTVFTGSSDSPTVIETDITDNSGKTGVFKLATPNRAFSENATSEETPYAHLRHGRTLPFPDFSSLYTRLPGLSTKKRREAEASRPVPYQKKGNAVNTQCPSIFSRTNSSTSGSISSPCSS